MQRNEHRESTRSGRSAAAICALIDDGILLQQDGSLLTGWSFRGPDMMSAAPRRDGCAQRPPEPVLAAWIAAGWSSAMRSGHALPDTRKQARFPIR